MGSANLEFGGWIWRYDLEPVGDDRTEVTLTYDWSGVPPRQRENIAVPAVRRVSTWTTRCAPGRAGAVARLGRSSAHRLDARLELIAWSPPRSAGRRRSGAARCGSSRAACRCGDGRATTSALSSRRSSRSCPCVDERAAPHRCAVRLRQLLFLPAPQQVSHRRRRRAGRGCRGSRPPRRCPPASPSRTTSRRRSPDRVRRRRRGTRIRCPRRSARRASARPARHRAGRSSVSRCGLPSTWLRWASISLASSSRLGTDGRKMLAVSPGRRDRTNRPIAWAKNSGVDALVA